MKVLDFQHNGVGDIVLGCWLVRSAHEVGVDIRLNPRNHKVLPGLFGLAHFVSSDPGIAVTTTEGVGTKYEYSRVHAAPQSRFDYWADSLNLSGLVPVRPDYRGSEEDSEWARQQWAKIEGGERILIFPDAAWPVRQWPLVYSMDLIRVLKEKGAAVTAMSSVRDRVEKLNCHHYWGFSLGRVAAMAAQADLVVGNDSGTSHLAGTIGTKVIAVMGPTQGKVVFGHDQNVRSISLCSQVLDCIGCHFSQAHGYRDACGAAGCRGLMLLTPESVLAAVEQVLKTELASPVR